MKCFNHPEVPAIGICKACSKGLCSDCVTDLGHGLACKGIHEERVEALELIISQSAKAYSDAPKNMFLLPAFLVFMGLIFVGFALFEGEKISSFPVVMGVGFVFFGLVFFVRNRKIFSNNRKETEVHD